MPFLDQAGFYLSFISVYFHPLSVSGGAVQGLLSHCRTHAVYPPVFLGGTLAINMFIFF